MEISGQFRQTRSSAAGDAPAKQHDAKAASRAEIQPSGGGQHAAMVESANTSGEGQSSADNRPNGEGSAAVPDSQQQRMADILNAYGYKVNDKNLAMLSLMLDNGLPLTKEQVARMNQALKLTDSPEKALFLLNNGIRLTQGNAAQLEGLLNGSVRISEQIANLLTAISELSDPVLQRQLLHIFSSVENADAMLNAATLPSMGKGDMLNGQPQAVSDNWASLGEAPIQDTSTEAGNTAEGTNTLQPDTNAVKPDGTAFETAGARNQQQPQTAATLLTDGAAASKDNQAAPETNANPNARAGQPNNPNGENPIPERISSPERTSQSERTGLPLEAGAIPETNARMPAARPKESLRLSFRLADSTPADIDRFINTLRDALREAGNTLKGDQNESPAASRVLREIQSVSEHIDFVAQIKNQLFVQLPIYNNGHETQTTLHVYRDASKKDKQKGTATQSALVALETAYLGHFETYVQKKTQSVTCQFRLRDKQVEKLVRTNIHKLEALLGEYRYSLDAFSFLPPGEPYTLLDSPGLFEGADEEATENTSFVFDQKV